ncbi:hypothetical protein Tco_1109738 [Tanacetum coccineum]|uniref:Hybrid signal transduction histidine kinase M n=1 Tax=Tanacetum coccineum TaxID=301880 RepID=A0ABQ5IGV5_9ASTR
MKRSTASKRVMALGNRSEHVVDSFAVNKDKQQKIHESLTTVNFRAFMILLLDCGGVLDDKDKSSEGTSSSAPDAEWYKLDDLIKMCILHTLCDSLQEQVVSTTSNAKDLWDHIQGLFHDNKDVRAISLDNELRFIKIRKKSINEYCTKIKSMTDRLKNLALWNMLLLKESSLNEENSVHASLNDSSSSLTILMVTTSDKKCTTH